MLSSFSITPQNYKLLVFVTAKFLLDLGFVCGFFPAIAIFVENVGTTPLFYAYLGSSICAIAFVGLFYLLSKRINKRVLIVFTYLLMGLAVLFSWFLLSSETLPVSGYVAIRSIFYGIFILAEILYWGIAGEAFEVFDAKRYFPKFVAAGMIGFMCGGVINTFFAARLQAVNIILIWALSLIIGPLLITVKSKRQIELEQIEEPTIGIDDDLDQPVLKNQPNSFAIVALIFAFWACYSFLYNGMDFVFNTKVLETFERANQITSYIGMISCIAAFCIITYQLFIAGPLTENIGADGTAFILPGLIAVTITAVIIFPSLITISIAQVSIYYFIDYAALALFQPILNTSASPFRARLSSEGLGRPIGIILLLVFVVSLPALAQYGSIQYVLFFISLLFLIHPFIFQRIYVRYLSKCLNSNDSYLLNNAIQALGERNKKKAVKPLLSLLRETHKIDLKRNIILSLGHIRSGEALKTIVSLFSVRNEAIQNAVVEALGNYKNYESTFAIFRLMNSSQNVSFNVKMNAVTLLTRLLGKSMGPFLLSALDSDDMRIKANAIESLGLLKDRRIIPVLFPYLDHTNHRIRANTTIALYQFRHTRENLRKRCESILKDMFQSTSKMEKSAAIYAIGKLGLVSYLPDLKKLLANEDKQIKILTCVALALMKKSVFAPIFMKLLLDEDEQFAIEAAKRISIFPRVSKLMLFHEWSILTEKQRWLVMQRYEATGLDFSEVKALAAQRKLVASVFY